MPAWSWDELRPWLSAARRLRRPLSLVHSLASRGDALDTWPLRHGGTLLLRRNSRDLAMFREVFGQHVYDPPPAADAALRALARPIRILDLGANVGTTAVRLLQLYPDASITSFEPDPDNLQVLRRVISANGHGPSWQLVEACAGTAPGTVRFIAGEQANSHLAAPNEPGAVEVPVVDCLPEIVRADLVKIDVEGGEWALLTDPRFGDLQARAIVMEHHGRHSPAAAPRQTATRILEELGFTVLHLAGSTPSLGMLWAWR